MAEAAVSKGRPLPPPVLDEIRGMAASTENYGNFYGQLMFIAAGGLLLIKVVMEQSGYQVDLMKMAIPTGVLALAIAAVRYTLFDRRMVRLLREAASEEKARKGGEAQ